MRLIFVSWRSKLKVAYLFTLHEHQQQPAQIQANWSFVLWSFSNAVNFFNLTSSCCNCVWTIKDMYVAVFANTVQCVLSPIQIQPARRGYNGICGPPGDVLHSSGPWNGWCFTIPLWYGGEDNGNYNFITLRIFDAPSAFAIEH